MADQIWRVINGDDMAGKLTAEESKAIDSIATMNPIEVKKADEFEASSEYFNYRATLDKSNGFTTLFFNIHPNYSMPPVFDAISKIVRKIVISRDQSADEPGYWDQNLPGLCFKIHGFTGGLMVGSRERILGQILPNEVYESMKMSFPK